MDRILFESILKECILVPEDTEYLEIYNYRSGPPLIEHHKLGDEDFNNFVRCEGTFRTGDRRFGRPSGSTPTSGLRLVMQMNSTRPNTFAGHHISLTRDNYRNLIEGFRLPWRALEGTCTVGPFFWTGCSGRGPNRVFQIMARKSDVLKKGKTRGWELMLSYNFTTRITSGYYKSTESAKPKKIVELIKDIATAPTLAHPFVLPMLIMSLNELSSENDDRQRQARELLRHLENAIAGRDDAELKKDHVNEHGIIIIEQINRDLYECVCKVLWKRPRAYLSMLSEVGSGLEHWWKLTKEHARRSIVEAKRDRKDLAGIQDLDVEHDEVLLDLQESMLSKVTFYSVKLRGIESYAWTSMERLKVQREALYNIIAQRESKLNLEMAKSQKHIANASKRDGTTMKTLSILGAIFLPGTFLASVFSMTFFNFQDPTSPTVSSDFWVYFAITIPVTIVVIIGWFIYEAFQRHQYRKHKQEVNEEIHQLEANILTDMHARTVAHRNTTLQSRPTWRQNGPDDEMKGPEDPPPKEKPSFFGHTRGHSHSQSLTHSISAHFGHNRGVSTSTAPGGIHPGIIHSHSYGNLGPVSQLAAQSMTNLTPHGIHGGVNAATGRSPNRSPQLMAITGSPVTVPQVPMLSTAVSEPDIMMKAAVAAAATEDDDEGATTAMGSGSGSSRDGPEGDEEREGGRRWILPEKRSEASMV